MPSARISPFCRKHIKKIAIFTGEKLTPRNTTQRNIALNMYKNQFCLFWKSQILRFNKAIEVIKSNFRVIDNVIYDKHVKIFIKYVNKLKKVQFQLTIMVIYDI